MKHNRRVRDRFERPLAQGVGEILLWWLLLAVVWLATVTTRTPAELAAAVMCTLPCAVVARSARRANDGQWRFRIGWLRWATTLGREVATQPPLVWRYGLASLGGGTHRRAVISARPLPAESAPVAAARRAAAVLALATTPDTVVPDSDPGKSELLVHRIGPRPGRLEELTRR